MVFSSKAWVRSTTRAAAMSRLEAGRDAVSVASPAAPAAAKIARRMLPFMISLLKSLFRRPARPGEVGRLDRLRLELPGRSQHLFDRRVEGGLCALLEPQRIDPGDDERAQVGALESLRLEPLDRGRDGLFELHHPGCPVLPFLERLRQLLLEKLLHALQDGVVGASRKTAVLLIADAERQQSRLVEIERVILFRQGG